MDKATLRVSYLSKGVAWLEFTQHHHLNPFTKQQYIDLSEALDFLATDPCCNVVVITANGRLFSSGTDLLSVLSKDNNFPSKHAEVEFYHNIIQEQAGRVVHTMINFPKVLIYAPQAGAIGFATTISQLCDFVYISDQTFFHTPFMLLGFCAEGCSSYTFPRVLGPNIANELLLGCKKLNAQRSIQTGFANAMFPLNEFKSRVLNEAAKIGLYDQATLIKTKQLTRKYDIDILHKVCDEELWSLAECFATDYCKKALANFAKIQQKKHQDKLAQEIRLKNEENKRYTTLQLLNRGEHIGRINKELEHIGKDLSIQDTTLLLSTQPQQQLLLKERLLQQELTKKRSIVDDGDMPLSPPPSAPKQEKPYQPVPPLL